MNSNEHFQLCIDIIKEYNNEISECIKKNQEMKNGAWKLKFNHLLYSLLIETIQTKERIIQRKFAEKFCLWAIDQLE